MNNIKILRQWWKNIRSDIHIKKYQQRKFCNHNNLPYIVPEDGICFRCKKQIYEKISFQKASKKHIRRCPYCYLNYYNK